MEEKIYDKKTCAHCGCNGIVKKATLIFNYSYSAKCCFYCIEKLGGIENAKIWLKKHAQYNQQGKYWFE